MHERIRNTGLRAPDVAEFPEKFPAVCGRPASARRAEPSGDRIGLYGRSLSGVQVLCCTAAPVISPVFLPSAEQSKSLHPDQ
jgi:hypothetical protein